MATSLTEKEKLLCTYHAEMCKVLSHPTRLEIINLLRDREMGVGELAQALALGLANLSQHLNMMRERRILKSRKMGNQVYYHIANPKFLKAFDLLREILMEQLEEESLLLGPANTRKR
ncbi:MAG: transcriptional regulator [candidate division Zixibacteria bacterium RBG_16_48_11]|nr:MAG: transcriptional regulator [candidate division Zixibacteria bacterium RBG_16_48_11]